MLSFIILHISNLSIILYIIPIIIILPIYEFYLLHTQLKFVLISIISIVLTILDNLYINYTWINIIPFINFYGYMILFILSYDYINTFDFGEISIHFPFIGYCIFLWYIIIKIFDVLCFYIMT